MTRSDPCPESCPETVAILAASRAGTSDAGHDAHLAGCAACRDALSVERALAAAASEPVRLPFPGALRLRARIRLRERTEARARLGHQAVLTTTLVASLIALGSSLAQLLPGAPRAGLVAASVAVAALLAALGATGLRRGRRLGAG